MRKCAPTELWIEQWHRAANRDTEGPNGGSQVGLGAILSYFYPEGDQINLASDTRDLIHHLEQSNSTLRVAGSQRPTELDGRRGLVTILQSDSPFGGPEQDRLLTIATADGMFYLMFVAPLDQYRNAQQTFDPEARQEDRRARTSVRGRRPHRAHRCHTRLDHPR